MLSLNDEKNNSRISPRKLIFAKKPHISAKKRGLKIGLITERSCAHKKRPLGTGSSAHCKLLIIILNNLFAHYIRI